MTKYSKLHSLSALALASFSYSHAATVLSEDFSYDDGPLVTATGSPWATHSGTAEQVDVASGAITITFAESEDVNAPLDGGSYTTGVMTATFDVTFTALPSLSGSYFAHFKDDTFGFRARLVASTTGAADGFFRLGISNGSGSQANTTNVATDLSLNTAYSVAMVWNADDLSSTLSVDGGSVVTAPDVATGVAIESFAFRQASGIGTMTIDNLEVDYVPEPTTALLGALGLLGLLRRRR